jgi:hypothetical protein
MSAVQGIVLLARFLSELAALAAFAIWGIDAAGWLGILLPIAMAAFWGRWMAPRSESRLTDPQRLIAELVIFGAATAALIAVDATALAAAFAVVAIGCAVLVRYLGEEPGATPAA